MNNVNINMVYLQYVNGDEFLSLMLMKIFLYNMDMNVVVHLLNIGKENNLFYFVIYLNEQVYVFEDEQIV